MSARWQNSLALASRLLLALVFLPAGVGKITGFSATAGYIASMGLPLPSVAAVLAAAVEIIGGLALIAGYGTRYAACALVLFTWIASFIFHAFWSLPADQQMLQQLMFFKNLGITGGLLALAAFGAGGWSLDGRRHAFETPRA